MRALEPEQRGKPSGADHAGDGARFHHRDRLLLRGAIDITPPLERMMLILPPNFSARR